MSDKFEQLNREQKILERLEAIEEKVDKLAEIQVQAIQRSTGYEYKSATTLFGLPLIHIATGVDPATGKVRVAKGIIAIGGIAIGGLTMGGMGIGVISLCGLSLGLICFGGVAIGLLFAAGGLAVGTVAIGGLAIGYVAIGGGAIGVYTLSGENPNPEQIRQFFRTLLGQG